MDNYIRIGSATMPVDLANSGVSATIDHGSDDVSFSISANVEEDHLESFEAVSMDLEFVPAFKFSDGWSSLSNKRIDRSYQTGNDLILPDDPATIYTGWHRRAVNNAVQFSGMEGDGFRILWKCIAKDMPEDAGTPVELNSWLPITSVSVTFPELFRSVVENTPDDDVESLERGIANLEFDFEKSLGIISNFFDRTEYSEPTRLRWGLRFPYQGRAE